MSEPSVVHIVDVHPDLLGTYGDGGNAVVLAQRLRWRGLRAEVHRAMSDRPIPSQADIYCLGGGEDGPQARSARCLDADGGLARAHERGAVVLAVCAGFQIVGESFAASDGTALRGLGLVGVRSVRGMRRRAVGELLVAPAAVEGPLTGYENHAGITLRGAGVAGLGRVLAGTGNGGDDQCDGVMAARLVGTYMHGPVLARNPALADLILSWVVGSLSPLDDTEVAALRAQRLSAVRVQRLARLARQRVASVGPRTRPLGGT